MPYELDPELVPAMTALAMQAADALPIPRDDWKALREAGNRGQAAMAALVPPVTGVRTARHTASAKDGALIELRWYTVDEPIAGPAVVYAHGGGMILGSLDLYDEVVSWYTAQTRVPFLSVGYRLAPEAYGTTLAEDVFAGLTWLHGHADELGVDRAGIAVMGDSGGAPAAGAAILARDRGVPAGPADPRLPDAG